MHQTTRMRHGRTFLGFLCQLIIMTYGLAVWGISSSCLAGDWDRWTWREESKLARARILEDLAAQRYSTAARVLRRFKTEAEWRARAGTRGQYVRWLGEIQSEIPPIVDTRQLPHDLRLRDPTEVLFGLFSEDPDVLTEAERITEIDRIADEVGAVIESGNQQEAETFYGIVGPNLLCDEATRFKQCISQRWPRFVEHWQEKRKICCTVMHECGPDPAGETSICEAAACGQSDVVRRLLEEGADPNGVGCSSAPLLVASLYGHQAVVNLLLEYGADPNLPKDRPTALGAAAAEGCLGIVRILLASGADPDIRNHLEKTPLHEAAWRDQLEVGELLLESGANPNVVDEYGKAPLHSSVWYSGHVPFRSTRFAALLIDYGAILDATDLRGMTPLHCAIEHAHLELSCLLLRRGADPNAVYDHLVRREMDTAVTPLHDAARYGHANIAEALLDAGADIEARTGSSRTPLHYAAASGWVPVARLLVARGADLHATDNKGRTPLRLARKEGRKLMTAYLKGCVQPR